MLCFVRPLRRPQPDPNLLRYTPFLARVLGQNRNPAEIRKYHLFRNWGLAQNPYLNHILIEYQNTVQLVRSAAEMGTEKEADKMIKEAKGLCQPSVFNLRLKADWEQATPLYEKAALIYKVRPFETLSKLNSSNQLTTQHSIDRFPQLAFFSLPHCIAVIWRF